MSINTSIFFWNNFPMSWQMYRIIIISHFKPWKIPLWYSFLSYESGLNRYFIYESFTQNEIVITEGILRSKMMSPNPKSVCNRPKLRNILLLLWIIKCQVLKSLAINNLTLFSMERNIIIFFSYISHVAWKTGFSF